MHSLNEIQRLITDFEKKYHRIPGSVQLLAASKGQSIEKIQLAYQAGQRLFGENYLQEALAKMANLPPDIEWHFIGNIQRNKTRKIAENFSWVQSVDDIVIAKRLNDQRPAHLPPLNICIQLNINHEETKSGIADISYLGPLINACLASPRLQLRGLMAIPEPSSNFQEQRNIFHQLFNVYQALQQQHIPLDTLSMGMSSDYEAAIAEGSTMVRLGTAVFGRR